jgi:hypothetical protein
MRTKTLLCTAAVVAAGIGASVAQSVYSVNSVGYVNVTLQSGFNLISNPLKGTNNNVNTIIPTAPADTTIQRWNVAAQTFLPSDTYYFVGPGDPQNGWYDDDLNPSTTIINPGEGFFIQNVSGSPTTITFVGEVPQGPLTNNIGANFGFYSSIVPQSVDLLSIGFPGVADMTYTTWNTAQQTYNSALTYYFVGPGDPDNGFYDDDLVKVAPTPAVAQGFLIFNPSGGTLPWERTFSVN